MYCPNCGKELPEGSNFCPNCGNSINSPTAQPQTISSSDQDIPSPEQQNTPLVPDEKVICPKCGATGCTPQYKQNISGGGYGCLQGGLGALILGPFGLLCGLCGRSVKTTNNVVWLCPKCGHEFRPAPHVYERGIWGLSIIGSVIAVLELCVGFYANGKGVHDFSRRAGAPAIILLYGLAIIALCLYINLYKFPFTYTDKEKEKIKKCAIIVVAAILVCFLISII